MEDFKSLDNAAEIFKAHAIKTNGFELRELVKIFEPAFEEEKFRVRTPSKTGGGTVFNILILRFDAVGDFILTSAAIRELRANYPSAFITLVVRKLIYPLAEFCPYVNEVLSFDFSGNILENFAKSVEFSKKHFWKRHYNIGFSFRYWTQVEETLLLYLSGAQERIGYFGMAWESYIGKMPPDTDSGYALLTRPILPPKEIINDTARSLYALKFFGLRIERTFNELWYSAEDLYQAEKILEGFAAEGMKIAVGIGAGAPARHYPVEKYLIAFEKIIEKGASLVIFGGPSEIEDAKFLQDNLPAEFVKNIIPLNLNWRMTAALISLMDLYLGNDTGTAHCAATSKIPTITLSPEAQDRELTYDRGFSQYSQYYPYQNTAIVLRPEHPLENCNNLSCLGGCAEDKPHCITQIEPDEIVDAFVEMVYFMKFSKIKKTGAAPVLNPNDSVDELFFKFDFK